MYYTLWLYLNFHCFHGLQNKNFVCFIMQAEHNDKILNTPVFYYTSAVFTVHTIKKECI